MRALALAPCWAFAGWMSDRLQEPNRYEPPGHRRIIQSGELPSPLVGSHIYDLTVNASDFTFAVDGVAIVTAKDSAYSGGIVDFAAEPRCVIFITSVAHYTLP